MDDGYLFQFEATDDQINTWVPLNCTTDNPQNCAPTALALIKVVPRDVAQNVSRNVEIIGMYLVDLTKLIIDYMPRFYVNLIPNITLEQIHKLIDAELKPGNITMLGISQGLNITDVRHVTTLAKKLNGDVVLYDGQYNMSYSGEDVNKYLLQFNKFYYWRASIKLKRKLSDVLDSTLRKPKTGSTAQIEPLNKKRKIGIGGKLNKSVHKKTQKNKKRKTRRKY